MKLDMPVVEIRRLKSHKTFLNHPFRPPSKKIVQCLWVPIVICGALKLVCLIVTASWDRCFPPASNRPGKESQVLDPTSKDLFEIFPKDVISETFSYLNLHELGVSRSVSKEWNTFVSTPTLWKAAIYREIAFSSKNWAQWDEDIVKGVDFTKEHLSLPENVVEELRLSYNAFPGKRIRETHVLVRMPKELTIKKFGELTKKYFPSNNGGRLDELGDKPADESVWLLMTTKEIDGTRNKSYIEQKNIVDELAKTAQVPYEVPTTLEAVICILAEYFHSRKYLFSNDRATFIRCQESANNNHMVVGFLNPAGFVVDYGVDKDVSFVVAALRKF
jgi:hypothetical protein